MSFTGHPVRVLIVPGLYGSGPAHWQTWLQSRMPHAVRVEQDDWTEPDLERWASRIGDVVAQAPKSVHVAVAHSFGCLALAHYIGQCQTVPARDDAKAGVLGALLVAPAEPERFRVADRLPRSEFDIPSVVFASDTDPWMSACNAQRWARVWGSRFVNLGDAGHINTEAGFGPLPRALHHTQALIRSIEQSRRVSRAHVGEFSFGV